MRVAVDAMGGDLAPQAPVHGAVLALAAASGDLEVVLVGHKELIESHLRGCGGRASRRNLSIVHAGETIDMHESPTSALRRKQDASIAVATRLHKQGDVDAVVAAGNTGAAMASSLLTLGRLEGVSRPAIVAPFPAETGVCHVLDVGANAVCRPQHLYEFAMMGSSYVSHMAGIQRPTVGLLSIGEEPTKGNDLTLATHTLLERSSLNYIGNVEGHDILKGKADLVVCDGFVGNILLKFDESMWGFLSSNIRRLGNVTLTRRLGVFLFKPALRDFKKKLDSHEYGGAPLLGINGVTIICHGSSSPMAIRNAIRVAERMVKERVNHHITEQLRAHPVCDPATNTLREVM